MFSSKEATALATRALGQHAGQEAAEAFRRTFEPYSRDRIPPPRGSQGPITEANLHGARVCRLNHVTGPGVLEALAQSAQAGDRAALELLIDVARDPYVESYGRRAALANLARHFPTEAGEVAVSLMREKPVNGHLGSALIGQTRTPELVPALERIATHPDYVVRQDAMMALVELGEPGSEALARLLLSTDPEVRHTAANAVMCQKLATEPILKSIQELSRRFPEERVKVEHLTQIVGSSGFTWCVADIAAEARSRLEAHPEAPQAAEASSTWSFGRLFGGRSKKTAAPEADHGPQKGLLDWARESSGVPLTREDRVAESLVKLAMLRPQVLFELARASASVTELGEHGRFGRVDLIEMWRAEQRDSKVLRPLARQLEQSETFRERVREIIEAHSS
ncbi:MAG: hypothetical protein KatS3mg108_2547 [Isosphaeraceae bacterium]|jgi:hypothetical protein|nr:MAG: hypothetical protein KatS3mg108_2547 [Isosphaeraceae bacterium]